MTFQLVEADLDTCLQRNSLRPRKVSEDIIKEQWNNLNILKKNFKFNPHLPVESLKIENNGKVPCYIFDIDGTLAHHNDQRSPFEWHKVHQDSEDPSVSETAKLIKRSGHHVIICSGRDEVCRKQTEDWLEFHGIEYDELHMRPQNDFRKDSIIKEEMWRDIISRGFKIIAMFDDRNQVVDHARSLGFKVYQVQEGDF